MTYTIQIRRRKDGNMVLKVRILILIWKQINLMKFKNRGFYNNIFGIQCVLSIPPTWYYSYIQVIHIFYNVLFIYSYDDNNVINIILNKYLCC